MANRITHDVAASIGEYTNNQGETKKRYVNVGKVFSSEDGRMSIKLDAVPVGPNWSGWLSLYPIQRDDQRQSHQRAQNQDRMPPGRHQQRSMPPAPAAPDDMDQGDEDDIPF